MIERRQRITAAGAAVFMVVHDEGPAVRAKLLSELDVPYPILIDVEKRAYRAWGLRRTTASRLYLSPRTSWNFVSLLLRGERFRGFGRDTLQLGGDFIIDSDGRAVCGHAMQDAGDRMPAEALVHELERLTGLADTSNEERSRTWNAGIFCR